MKSPETMKIMAVEQQSTAEVEVLVLKTVEGVLQLQEIEDSKVQRNHPKNHTLLTTISEETWRTFKEEAKNLSKASQTVICEDGIREIVNYLNPRQLEGQCSP